MTARKWTRACPEYKRIIKIVAEKFKITEREVDRVIKVYLFQCKRLMVKGSRVQLPGIMHLSIHPKQIEKMKYSYKQRKKRYQKKQYFQKYIFKGKKDKK